MPDTRAGGCFLDPARGRFRRQVVFRCSPKVQRAGGWRDSGIELSLSFAIAAVVDAMKGEGPECGRVDAASPRPDDESACLQLGEGLLQKRLGAPAGLLHDHQGGDQAAVVEAVVLQAEINEQSARSVRKLGVLRGFPDVVEHLLELPELLPAFRPATK